MPLTALYQNNDALIEIDALKKYLQITWLKHPSSESFRHIVTLASAYARDKQITSWLCDMRKLHYIEMGDQNWLVKKIYPALTPTKHHELAYVVSKEDLELYTSFRIQDLVEADPQLSKILHIEIFFEKGLALQWLQSYHQV